MSQQTISKCSFLSAVTTLLCLATVTSAKCTGYRSPVTFRSTAYTITSPRYPRSYSDHENCRFLLSAPFTHPDFMLVLNVTEYETSYLPHGETARKCTGRLSFFKSEVDCRSVKPFCQVYYASSYCAPIVQEAYPECKIQRRSRFNVAEVKFTSGSYYPSFTPQKGFKLKYKFEACKPKTTTPTTTTTVTTTTVALTTTQASTTRTTTSDPTTLTTTTPTTTTTRTTTYPTTSTTTAPATTKTTTYPTTASSTTATLPITTTIDPTSSASTFPTATTATRSTTYSTTSTSSITSIPDVPTTTIADVIKAKTRATEPIKATSPVIIGRPHILTLEAITQHLTATRPTLTTSSTYINRNKTIISMSNITSTSTDSSFLTSTSTTQGTSTAGETNSNIKGTLEEGNQEKQTGKGPPKWIYAPIVVGVVLIIIFVFVVIVVRRRKRKEEDISWLVGFDNPQFRDFNEKEVKETIIDTGPSAPANYYQLAPN